LLNEALVKVNRVSSDLDKVLLNGHLSDERPLESLDAFVDWAGRYGQIGITELVIHWPEPDSPFDTEHEGLRSYRVRRLKAALDKLNRCTI